MYMGRAALTAACKVLSSFLTGAISAIHQVYMGTFCLEFMPPCGSSVANPQRSGDKLPEADLLILTDSRFPGHIGSLVIGRDISNRRGRSGKFTGGSAPVAE